MGFSVQYEPSKPHRQVWQINFVTFLFC